MRRKVSIFRACPATVSVVAVLSEGNETSLYTSHNPKLEQTVKTREQKK